MNEKWRQVDIEDYPGVRPKVLDLRIYPDPILKEASEEIEVDFDDSYSMFGGELLDTMNHNKGAGLSAPQVGALETIIAVSHQMPDNDDPRGTVMINPVFLPAKDEGMEVAAEGCLSVPDYSCLVPRWRKGMVHYYDLAWNSRKYLVSGLVARVIQHEIDHLDGILIMDKEVSP